MGPRRCSDSRVHPQILIERPPRQQPVPLPTSPPPSSSTSSRNMLLRRTTVSYLYSFTLPTYKIKLLQHAMSSSPVPLQDRRHPIPDLTARTPPHQSVLLRKIDQNQESVPGGSAPTVCRWKKII